MHVYAWAFSVPPKRCLLQFVSSIMLESRRSSALANSFQPAASIGVATPSRVSIRYRRRKANLNLAGIGVDEWARAGHKSARRGGHSDYRMT
jgi:hypothetical protein